MKQQILPNVLDAIEGERGYQTIKWGSIAQHPHEVGGYITIMRKLLNDAEIAWSSVRGDYGALDEIRKVVTVGIACMEQHGPVVRIEKAQDGCHATGKYAEPITDWRVPKING